MPPEINRLGRTIWRWRHQIANWHTARVTNAATEAANNLAKRVKRAAFGFTNFNNYRIRALLYAGKPNWGPPQHPHPTLKREKPLESRFQWDGTRITLGQHGPRRMQLRPHLHRPARLRSRLWLRSSCRGCDLRPEIYMSHGCTPHLAALFYS